MRYNKNKSGYTTIGNGVSYSTNDSFVNCILDGWKNATLALALFELTSVRCTIYINTSFNKNIFDIAETQIVLDIIYNNM